MSPAERAHLTAAQVRADELVAGIAESPDGDFLLVSVTDPVTGQRLATCFVTYEADHAPILRAVSP